MSSVKGLDDAMMREEPTKARDETVVKAFHKLGTHTDGEVLLVCEWPCRAHQLPKIRLDRTDNLIALAVDVDLMNVVQGRMQLVAVARTELEVQGVAYCAKGQPQNLGLDLHSQCRTIGAGVRQSKTCWLKLHWAILKCSIEDLSLDIGRRECTKIRGTMEGHEVICNIVAIGHGSGGLRQL